jgi:hypothetical protein
MEEREPKQQQEGRLPTPPSPVTSAMVIGRETAVSSSKKGEGPCPSFPLLGRLTHTVYLIRVRARGRQWVVRRRYRQFYALHQEVQDGASFEWID